MGQATFALVGTVGAPNMPAQPWARPRWPWHNTPRPARARGCATTVVRAPIFSSEAWRGTRSWDLDCFFLAIGPRVRVISLPLCGSPTKETCNVELCACSTPSSAIRHTWSWAQLNPGHSSLHHPLSPGCVRRSSTDHCWGLARAPLLGLLYRWYGARSMRGQA